MSRLHVFDMDGTLLRGTSASLEIARHLGCLTDLIHLESEFAADRMSTREFALEIVRLWQNLTPDLVAHAFAQAPWIDRIRDVFTDIRRRGEWSLAVTMSPDFFASRLSTFGVDEVVASRFPALPFRVALDPEMILSPTDKITAVDRVAGSLGLGRADCIAYGDSRSDGPLFQKLTHTVAVNADDSLRRLARYHYEGKDLMIPYRLARTRVSASASSVTSSTRPGEGR